MQLGIGTYTYGWNVGANGSSAGGMNETDLLSVADRFGIKLIQLADNLPLHAFPERRRTALSRALQEYDVCVELGARGMSAAHLERYIILCKEMRSPLLRFLIDDEDFRPSLKETERNIRSQLPRLKDHGIKLALENHDRLKAEEIASLIEHVGCEYVGVCLDTANSFGAAEDPDTVVKALGPYTLNLHLKDFVINRLPYKMGFKIEGCPAGTGMLDIAKLISKIAAFGRCGTVILEQWAVPEDTMDKTLEKEKRWADDSIRYLMPLFNIDHT